MWKLPPVSSWGLLSCMFSFLMGVSFTTFQLRSSLVTPALVEEPTVIKYHEAPGSAPARVLSRKPETTRTTEEIGHRVGKVSPFLKFYGLGLGNMETPPIWKSGIKHRTVIDVGANDGADYSIPAVIDGQHVVYAFEPVPSVVTRLLANAEAAGIGHLTTLIEMEPGKPVDMNKIQGFESHATLKKDVKIDRGAGHLFVIQAAASNKTGSGVIVERDQMSYVDNPSLSLDFTATSNKIEIALVRIDDIIHEDIFLFKSDAQGYDYNVFHGALGLFNNYHVEFATTEFTPKVTEALYPGATVDFLRLIDEIGFLCFDWSSNQHIPLERDSNFEGFAKSFLELCPPDKNCKCQDDHCFNKSLGKWEELVCVNLR